MKTVFIYYVKKESGRYVRLDISKIVNNHPIHLGMIKYQTAGFKGENDEVIDFLIAAGEIGIENRGIHYSSITGNDHFEIIKI